MQDNRMGKAPGIDQVGNMFRFHPGQPVSRDGMTHFGRDVVDNHTAN
jgi:hypothetical protein